jgi:hypothetical protein
MEDSPCHIDALPWPPGRIGRAPAWPGCGGPRAGSRGGGCAGPHGGESGAAAVAGGSRGKDNIDTSHRSSSSPRPGPAPQSWPADSRSRTSHHPHERHYPFDSSSSGSAIADQRCDQQQLEGSTSIRRHWDRWTGTKNDSHEATDA